MKVTRWKVNGFKSFAPIENSHVENPATELDVKDFNISIGKNNTGKSNLVKSFKFYTDIFLNQNIGRLHKDVVFNQDVSNPIDFRAEFELSSEERLNILDNLRESESLSEGVIEDIHDSNYFNRLRHSFTVKNNKVIYEQLETNYEGDWISVSLGNERKVTNTPAKSQRLRFQHLPSIKHGSHSVGINGIGAIFPPSYRSLFKNEIQSWESIEAFREPEDTQKAGKVNDLKPDGRNLVQVVNTLYNNHQSLFYQFRDRYVSIMEGVTDVSTPYVQGNNITIRIHEGAESYNLKDISSGSKEILTLIAGIVSSQNDTSLLLIEEPELHVHPGAEQEIFDLIQDVCREAGIQVLVSTHSEVFVNRSDASNIVRVEREGSTSIRSVSEGKIAQELTDIGYSKSGLLQSDAVVFVEGRSDKRILKEFCTTLGIDTDDEGIAFVELEGKENLKRDGRSLVKLLYSFDIPYLFVVDSDNQTPEEAVGELLDEINRLDSSGWWETSPENFHAWDEYSIESYLLDADIVARGNEFDIDIEDIEEIISDLEEVDDKAEVLEIIYQDAHDIEESESAYSKDRDGMYIAKRMKAEEIPNEVREVVEKIGELVGGSVG